MDKGGFTQSQCVLYHAWTVTAFNTTTNATNLEWKFARSVGERGGVTVGGKMIPVLRTVIGPYEMGYLITPICRNKSGAIKYAVSAKSAFQQKLVARLLLGIALLIVAPRVASSVTCFYTVAMTLSTLALALIVIHRFSRAIPGGRMMKRTAALAGMATYYLVPTEQWQTVMDMYVKMSLKPIQLTVGLIRQRYTNRSFESVFAEDPWALYGALTGFGLIVLGAGVGRWIVKSFVLDASTGGVAGSVRSFVTMFIRAIGCMMIQFSSYDAPCGTAMVACAATYCLYAPVARASDRIVDAAGRLVRRSSTGQLGDDFLVEPSDEESEEDFDDDPGVLHAFGLRARARPLPESMDPDPKTPPRRLVSPKRESRDKTPKKSPSLIRRAVNLDWLSRSSTANDADDASPLPPVGSAASAYGRFLTEDERAASAAIHTDQAMDALAKSPEFAEWVAKNSHRIRVAR